MMKRLLPLIVLLCGIAAIPLHAQESDVRIGFGASLILSDPGTGYSAPSSPTTIVSVPLLLGARYRIEPEFGLTSQFSHINDDRDTSSHTITTHGVRFGSGFHYIVPTLGGAERVSGFVGTRVLFVPLYRSQEDNHRWGSREYSSVTWDVQLGVLVGGEYAIARSFTVGAQAQINYTVFGVWSSMQEAGYANSNEQLTVNTVLTARFYFN